MSSVAENKIVCRCLGISESCIQDAAQISSCESLKDVKQATGAGTGCMSCHGRIKAMLREYAEKRALAQTDV